MRKVLETVERHADKILQRWYSTYTNACMEGLNSLFQAARARARVRQEIKDLYPLVPGGQSEG